MSIIKECGDTGGCHRYIDVIVGIVVAANRARASSSRILKGEDRCRAAQFRDESLALTPIRSTPSRRTTDRRCRPERLAFGNGDRSAGRAQEYKEPTSVLELEMQARCVAHRMGVYMAADNHYEFALKWLRGYYNLNFKMLCPKCASAHDYDELDAPER
ncbi:hypothetical protein EVAR_79024_1 [Eumeta japonica]|uniref:Uncharacterized protein n=1 Tax=Eumeta variegata TaxID=151549 RepID=A0A4C1XU80_EUMVA|nr:hypothetical protein EVAR_79024_1 [Eumeta japonica]